MGLGATPSPMSAESDYFENQIQVDKGRLGKSEPGPIDIATPWRQPCILYAAGWGASEGPPACTVKTSWSLTVVVNDCSQPIDDDDDDKSNDDDDKSIDNEV